MTEILTVLVDTREMEVDLVIDAFRSATVLAQRTVLTDKDKPVVSVGFPHDRDRDPQSRFDEVDNEVRTILLDAGLEAQIVGHGMSSEEAFA